VFSRLNTGKISSRFQGGGIGPLPNSNQARSGRLLLGNFNSGVSTMKHLKGMPGAGSVIKKGLVLNKFDTRSNKFSVGV